MNIPIWRVAAEMMVRRSHLVVIHINGDCVCISYVHASPPPRSRLPLAASLCFATSDWDKCLRECQNSIGAKLVSAHAFLCEMCHEHGKSFPFAFVAQASVEMDRHRGLCCWYTSITISLCLCSLVHFIHRPCLPVMTSIVVSAHGTRVGLVST